VTFGKAFHLKVGNKYQHGLLCDVLYDHNVGSTLSIMNKACKSGYHAWCAPMSTILRHHVKTPPPT
jgi:hypothetical protein